MTRTGASWVSLTAELGVVLLHYAVPGVGVHPHGLGPVLSLDHQAGHQLSDVPGELLDSGRRRPEEEGPGLVSGNVRHPLQLEVDSSVVVDIVVERFSSSLDEKGGPRQSRGGTAELGEVRTLHDLNLVTEVTSVY